MSLSIGRYSQHIAAPRETVWRLMLLDDAGYRDWTSAFCDGSYYEGSWEPGSEIQFLTPEGQGLMARVAQLEAPAHVQLRHQAEIENFQVKADGSANWKDCREEYWLHEEAGGTRVDVELEVSPDYEGVMCELWPKALLRLKQLCERGA